MPKVTVLMPVYNGEKYLREAIESILKQTFKDFEFLIINDGSTDKTSEIINSFSDPRIILAPNEKNQGLIFSLNKGLDLAQGEYIARMDADDISLPERLEKQINFMDANPEVVVGGTWVKNIGHKNFIGKYYTEHNQIKANLLFNSSLAHPTVMIRNIFKNHNLFYDEKYKHAEDFDLWTRAADLTKFTNLPLVLLSLRRHDENISQTQNQAQKDNSDIIRLRQLKKIGIIPTENEFIIHNSILSPNNLNFNDFFNQVIKWLTKIDQANAKVNYFDCASLKQILFDRLWLIASANAKHGLMVWKNFYNSPIAKNKPDKNCPAMIKLFLKCLIKS